MSEDYFISVATFMYTSGTSEYVRFSCLVKKRENAHAGKFVSFIVNWVGNKKEIEITLKTK